MDSQKAAVIYYSAAFISGLVLVSVLIHLFQWPVTASLVFGVSLYIQYMYLARKVYLYWNKAKMKGFRPESLLRRLPDLTPANNEMESEIS